MARCDRAPRLALGTVQFGLDYGIANPTGQTPAAEVASILTLAGQNGISLLDTAASYGNSETVLGGAMPAGHSFAIVSKTRAFGLPTIAADDAAALEADFMASLERLGVTRLYGLLLHHCDDLLVPGGERLLAAMLALKERGLVDKIGVSVYDREQIEKVLADFTIDLVQLPLNVLDQRLESGNYLQTIKRADIEIHARSVFLQGLLLMPPEELSDYFEPIRPLMQDYWAALGASGMTAVEAALAFVRRNKNIDQVLVGVTSRNELEEILTAFAGSSFDEFDFSRFAVADRRMVDPRLWQAAA